MCGPKSWEVAVKHGILLKALEDWKKAMDEPFLLIFFADETFFCFCPPTIEYN